MRYETGVNVFDYNPETQKLLNERFYPLTNQDLYEHYCNVGYSFQEEHDFASAVIQIYEAGDNCIAVIFPWAKDPAQLTEIHYQSHQKNQLLETSAKFLNSVG